jgi:AraC-like DNA-binding protein
VIKSIQYLLTMHSRDNYEINRSLIMDAPAGCILGWRPQEGRVSLQIKRHVRPDANWNSAQAHWLRGYFSLNCVLQGTGIFHSTDGHTYNLKPGTLYHRLSESNVCSRIEIECPFVEFFLVVTGKACQALELLSIQPESEVLNIGIQQPVLEDFVRLVEYVQLPRDEISHIRLKAMIVDFLVTVYDRATRQPGVGHWHRVVHAVTDFVSTHPETRISGPELAEQMNVSYSSLRREFKRISKQSLNEYRIGKRIDVACGLLSYLTVQEVADRLTYSSPFAFSAQFKARVGIPPSEFRRQLTEDVRTVR